MEEATFPLFRNDFLKLLPPFFLREEDEGVKIWFGITFIPLGNGMSGGAAPIVNFQRSSRF